MKFVNRTLKALLPLVTTVLTVSSISAQQLTHLWTGLRDPQPEETLPKGSAPFGTASRVAKKNIQTKLVQDGVGEWIISDGWEMTDATSVILSGQSVFDRSLDTGDWLNATVPGTVLTTLVDQGVYPDPFFGLNNMSIPDTLCRMDWWYRCLFKVPAGTENDRLRLQFNGINYMAEVFINGHKLGNIEGAFIRGEFDITQYIDRTGENILAVHILPPKNPGIPHEQSMAAGQGLNGGALSLDGPTFISSMGWDWIPGIRDRNIGIWQDVRLKAGGNVRIGDPLVITKMNLPDTTKATVEIRTTIKNTSGKPVSGNLTASFEKASVSVPYSLAPHEEKEIRLDPKDYAALNIKKPRLWWPNGYGNPELYDLTLEATEGGRRSDTKKLRFGIREMSYELMIAAPGEDNMRVKYTPNHSKEPGKPVFDYVKRGRFDNENQLPAFAEGADLSGIEKLPGNDPVGPYLVICVNGERIFCRGGNWGMDDGMKRSSRERLEPYVKLHREAGFNIIRNWTGESTEEVFYELCDEYGMLVWNDFWITTDDTVEPLDTQLFMRNATDAVRRYRNHPSIAIWCPRNEGFAPADMEKLLPEMMAKEDPTRHYHGQSRFLNMDSSGPWGYYKDPMRYFTHTAKGFNTEIGTFAIPTARTLKKFIAPEDRWPINDVWAYHDLHHTTQNFKDFMAAVNRYGEPTGLEDFSKKAQFVCYDAWRAIIESWNSRMWDNTTGQILWMSHPAWPSMIWQTYTYDYETPGSYFGAKKASEPLHAQMNPQRREIVLVNATRKKYRGLTVSVSYYNPLNGKILYSRSGKVDAEPNSLTRCFRPTPGARMTSLFLARVELRDGKKLISVNDYWLSDVEGESYLKLNSIGNARIGITVKPAKTGYTVEVYNPSSVPAVAVKLNAVDKRTGEVILPAYFSDGYINLLPQERRTLTLELPADFSGSFDVISEGYNL